jgi:integrase
MQAEALDPNAIDVGLTRQMLDGLDASDAERWHVFGGLSRFMSWCCKRDLAADNPCNALDRDERPKPGKARDNAPDIETLRNVWRAVENEAPEVRDLARLLLLTPLRLNEAAGLRWSEVDLNRGWIRIGGARMKNGEAHELPLAKPALEILMSCRERTASEERVSERGRDLQSAGEQRGERFTRVRVPLKLRRVPKLDPRHAKGAARDRTGRTERRTRIPMARCPKKFRHAPG